MVHQKSQRLSAFFESPDMRNEPAPLEGKEESFRCPFMPPFEDFPLREAIKGDIQFDRMKMPGIEFKPFSRRKIGWVKDAVPPVRIVITTRANVGALIEFGFRIADCGIRKSH